ncbi:MAG TPA: DUF4097 family beta strand repeat-containing protein [Bacteroidota bacterium]|nr:DUF4097 family beta strand repeat-containing protein [Bacteroidota bacterium]
MKTFLILLLSASFSLFDTPRVISEAPQDQDTQTKSFSVKKAGTLEVNIDPGTVEITPWEKDEVLIEAENVDERRPERLKITQSDNTVRIEYTDRRRNVRNLRFLVNVPSEFNVNVNTTGGNAIVNDRLKGNFKVDTDGGNVEMGEIVGQVEVRSSGGNIKAAKVDGDARLKTNGGNITVKMTTGELSVESGGGNIRIDAVGKKLKLTTGGGNITLGDIGATADVRTGGGNLDVGKVTARMKLVSGGGNIGVNGATDHIFLKTGGGNVKLKNIKGTLELTTGGGDVTVELTPMGKGESTIYSGGGDVTLYVPENAKANIEARARVSYNRGGRSKRIDVRSDYKADKFEKDKEEINATYVLNGGGDLIAVETSNGVIEIRKLR